jgi:hypothetical protein
MNLRRNNKTKFWCSQNAPFMNKILFVLFLVITPCVLQGQYPLKIQQEGGYNVQYVKNGYSQTDDYGRPLHLSNFLSFSTFTTQSWMFANPKYDSIDKFVWDLGMNQYQYYNYYFGGAFAKYAFLIDSNTKTEIIFRLTLSISLFWSVYRNYGMIKLGRIYYTVGPPPFISKILQNGTTTYTIFSSGGTSAGASYVLLCRYNYDGDTISTYTVNTYYASNYYTGKQFDVDFDTVTNIMYFSFYSPQDNWAIAIASLSVVNDAQATVTISTFHTISPSDPSGTQSMRIKNQKMYIAYSYPGTPPNSLVLYTYDLTNGSTYSVTVASDVAVYSYIDFIFDADGNPSFAYYGDNGVSTYVVVAKYVNGVGTRIFQKNIYLIPVYKTNSTAVGSKREVRHMYSADNRLYVVYFDSDTLCFAVQNSTPSINFVGETGYTNDFVEPDYGHWCSTYTFKIKYIDPDNDPPANGYPKLYILQSGTTIQTLIMNYESGNYNTGAVFSTSTLLSPCSYYSYAIEVKDKFLIGVSTTRAGPDVGYKISGYVFYPNGTTPFPSATVKIVGISTRTVITGSNGYYEIPATSSNTWTISVSSQLAAGSISFSPQSVTFTNINEDKTINFARIAGNPQLTYTNEPGYITDGIQPDVGASSDTFTFRIKYIDAENDPPANGYPKVRIMKGTTTVANLSMNYVSGDYVNGAIYSTSTLLAPCSYYSYRFECYDIWNSSAASFVTNTGPDVRAYIKGTVKFPNGTYMGSVTMNLDFTPEGQLTQLTDSSGTFVFSMLKTGINYTLTPSSYSYYLFSPTSISFTPLLTDYTTTFYRINRTSLTWTGETNYESDGLHPELDTVGGQVFTYRINYIDYDNDVPAGGFPRLYILKGGTTVQNVQMNEADPTDTNYTDGKIYFYQTTLSCGRDYSYYFVVKDTFNLVAQTITKSGPVVSTNTPQLVWTGEPNYVSDGLHPEIGTPKTTFYFRIRYKDADGNPPMNGYPRLRIKKDGVEISGSPFTMTPFGSTTNYITGVIYVATITNLVPSLNYTYFFETYDEYSKYAQTTEIDAPDVNTPPQLSWTGESGYTSDGVEPNIGCTISTFTFRIKYTDVDNHAPKSGYPKVYVLKDSQLLLSATMQYISGLYTTGAIYSVDVVLSTPSKNYSYYFSVYDVLDGSATTSLVSGPDVSGYNPQLSWTGESGYESDGVEPNVGMSTNVFTFKVKYVDADTNPPANGSPKVYILQGGTTIQILSMNYISGNYDTGAIFSTTTLLQPCSYYIYKVFAKDLWNYNSNIISAQGPEVKAFLEGTVSDPFGHPMQGVNVALTGYELQNTITDSQGKYRFYVTAGYSYTITPSSFVYQFNPSSRTVVATNDLSNLNFSRIGGNPVLSSYSVYPSTATPGTYFVFKVKYQDPENDPPATGYPKVRIYREDYEITGSPFTLNYESGSDFINGVFYSTSVMLSIPSDKYKFKFVAADEYNNLAETSFVFAPVVNTPPQLSWTGEPGYESDGLEPEVGDRQTTFYFKIKYIDADNHQPMQGYTKVYILQNGTTIQTLTMDYVSGVYNTGVIYSVKVVGLNLGRYTYNFVAYDSYGFASNLLSSTGPVVVNNNPVLTNPSVSPQEGDIYSTYTFTISYFDPDNDKPKLGYPKVYLLKNQQLILSLTMYNLQNDVYVASATLDAGDYQYYFDVFDSTDGYFRTTTLSGLHVSKETPHIFDNQISYSVGTTTMNYTFSVRYIDYDGDPPKDGYPQLSVYIGKTEIIRSTMVYIEGSPNSSALFSYNVSLTTPALYSYKIVAYDKFGWKSNEIVANGPKVSGYIPQLEIVSYAQEIAPDENFVVYVKYIDFDNDPPKDEHPKILFYLDDKLIKENSMNYISGNYQTGAVYIYSIKFSTVSDKYTFECITKDVFEFGGTVSTGKKSFVVSTPPSKPENLTSYQDKINNVVTTSKVTLKWKSIDPDPNSKIVYELYFGDSPENMKKIYEGENTEYTLYSLDDGKTYYWYVIAKDDTGRTSKSALFTFNTLDMQKDKVFNYPNPFKKGQKTNIVFYSDSDTTAEIYICSLFGNVLFKDTISVSKGSNIYEYDGSGLDFSGSYVVLVKTNNDTKKGKILLLNK